ncbi:hypothetical protein [Desulfarculus baarsii]
MIKRLIAVALLLAALAALAGCTAMNYGKYADKQAEVYARQADAETAIAQGLAAAATSPDERTQSQATMALLVMALTRKSGQLDAPQETSMERAAGSGLSALLQLGGARLLVDGVAGVVEKTKPGSNTTINQTVSGQGAGGVVGDGTANPATSTPTVVTQPEPVVVETGGKSE